MQQFERPNLAVGGYQRQRWAKELVDYIMLFSGPACVGDSRRKGHAKFKPWYEVLGKPC
jgi:hypothetical protein